MGIGGVSAFTDQKRLELIDELAPLVVRDEDGNAVKGDKDRNRFASADRDTSFVQLRPERVLEIRYDQMEGWRLRHAGIFERWRPDRDADVLHLRPARGARRLRLRGAGHVGEVARPAVLAYCGPLVSALDTRSEALHRLRSTTSSGNTPPERDSRTPSSIREQYSCDAHVFAQAG